MIYRQGDVLIRRTRKSIANAKPVARDHGRIVLAYGEVTGHAHAIDDALAELFEEKDGQIYLKVSAEGATVSPEEHGTSKQTPGSDRVVLHRDHHHVYLT